MEGLRHYLIETIGELNDLLLITVDKEKKQDIRKHRRKLTAQLDKIVEDAMNQESEDFKQAVTALKTAIESAKEAKKDIAHVADVIGYLASATKAVDQVLKAVA